MSHEGEGIGRMVSLAETIADARWQGTGFTVGIADNWKQGRTAYGGLSAALALEGARNLADDLPPLRSAQIAFVGPLGGAVRVEASLLRRGRSSAFVQADVTGEGGLGLRATFIFMEDQPSSIDYLGHAAPQVPPPVGEPLQFPYERPVFTRNFDYRPVIGWGVPGTAPQPDAGFWVRLLQADGVEPHVALLAVGDALPPAALALATRPGPVSSANWTVNFIQNPPMTRDGWWLLRSTAHHARLGGSSQSMGIWNLDGAPVAAAMQQVAIFC